MADDAELSSSSKHPPRSPSPSAFPRPTLTRLPSTSDLSIHSGDGLWAPDAAVALAGVHPPEISMEPEHSGHRRRKSSLMNSLDTSTKAKIRRSPQSPTKRRNSTPEEPKLERPSDESTSEDVELDELSDNGLQDDEETGLTGKDKSKRKRRRRRNTLMDQRVAAEVKITEEERKEADQFVMRNLLLNGTLIGLWYLFSLSISIYNKWMFDPEHLNFHFPLFTTCFHMIVQFSLSALVLFFLPQFRPRYDSLTNPNYTHVSDADQLQHQADSKKPLMTRTFYFTRIGPCGLATGLDIGLGNMSLKFITLTFYTMCKSSSLAFVLLFAFVFQLESPSWRLVAIITTMTAGVIMMVAGEVAFSALGFVLVISAAFFSGFRWALTQILLLRNPATANPFSSIFYLAPIMFVALFLIAIPVEGFPALFEGIKILIEHKGPILGPLLLLFPGTIAFCMTASEFALLKRTSVVTLSIAGIFKEVVTISAAGIVFGDNLTPINISGLVVTIGAIAAYNYIKITKMRAEAQKEAHQNHMGARDDASDGDDEESEEEDWNTVEGTYVTMDGDILPNPEAFKIKTPKKGENPRPQTNGHATASVEPSRAEIAALAASKKELSD
ncbi:TPT-domain-containing protein [Mollisia scopiformis]|uniref:TPT-domain-containing protein n=1 Tax=Mollisia scopiformis TaxID=149040 RepID=A0A194XEB4_MOLSC|nr:TPT-domain-containing protein [Mollisia scopiformis]KUJ18484.1 TPT-domain-containing protein [Mollisia scopiformis]